MCINCVSDHRQLCFLACDYKYPPAPPPPPPPPPGPRLGPAHFPMGPQWSAPCRPCSLLFNYSKCCSLPFTLSPPPPPPLLPPPPALHVLIIFPLEFLRELKQKREKIEVKNKTLLFFFLTNWGQYYKKLEYCNLEEWGEWAEWGGGVLLVSCVPAHRACGPDELTAGELQSLGHGVFHFSPSTSRERKKERKKDRPPPISVSSW